MEALDSSQISLEDTVPCSENASSMGGSQIRLTPTESLTVNEMIKCNCHVLDEDGHVTSAHDIALISRELLNNHPTITNLSASFSEVLFNSVMTTITEIEFPLENFVFSKSATQFFC